MLKISECSENCNACCVFKISAHVENCNACSKLCWIFQGMLKTCWKFQGMLKTIICVENYVETACWKFQHVLKTVTHVESHVKISSVLKMFILGMLKTILKLCEVRKNTITLYGTCWNSAADFVFLLRFCTRKRSETYYIKYFITWWHWKFFWKNSRCFEALSINVKYTSSQAFTRVSVFSLAFSNCEKVEIQAVLETGDEKLLLQQCLFST